MHRLHPEQTAFARELRGKSTDAEQALWQRLRNRQVSGAKFRRQFLMGAYVGDFVCIEARLVIECDGGQHVDSQHDASRDAWMQAQGWKVLRFWNNDVLQNLEGVLVVIAEALKTGNGADTPLPSPQPSPWEGEGVNATAPSPFKGEGWGEGR